MYTNMVWLLRELCSSGKDDNHLGAFRSWPIYPMDVLNVFSLGHLKEIVYMRPNLETHLGNPNSVYCHMHFEHDGKSFELTIFSTNFIESKYDYLCLYATWLLVLPFFWYESLILSFVGMTPWVFRCWRNFYMLRFMQRIWFDWLMF